MKLLRMRIRAAIVLASSSALEAAPGEAGALKVIPPHSIIHGETIGEWGARWWQWMAISPKGTNPVRDDRTGEFAHNGQAGWPGQPTTLECHPGSAAPVFFLAGNLGGKDTRNVTVPGGREILVPLFGSVQYNLRAGEFSVGELAERARVEVERVDTMELTLNGKVIPEEELRAHGEPFRFFRMCLPTNNVLDHAPGEYSPAVSDGYFVMLEPPAPGTYTIRWEVSAGGCESFCTDVTYRLEVVESLLIRGDADGTARVNVTDVFVILEHLFLGGSQPRCPDGGDTDDGGNIDLSDAVLILHMLFRGGDPFPPPFPECGTDPSADTLGICRSVCEF